MTPRYLAVQALVRQEQSGYANLVLDAMLKRCAPPFSQRDAAFATGIFYTVLERQNLLDGTLSRFTKKPLSKLDAPVRAILRAGLAQARYMQVPLPAAVNESVKLARAFGKTSAAGMVNAVLRRAAACDPQPQDWPDLLERLVCYYSLSRPVAALLCEQYGSEAEAMAAAFYERQPTWVRVNTLKSEGDVAQMLQAEGCRVAQGPLPHSLQVAFPGSPAASRAFARGLFSVQGLPSQYAAGCVAAEPGQRVLDLCAAPGGKSLLLAQQMKNRGTLVSAEGVASRVPLLQKNFDRCGVTCAQVLHSDASRFDASRGQFDRVLCDVPCSGLGGIGKKPDIRYKPLEGLDGLYALQKNILQNGARYLARNGRLVYATCTVNQLENEVQIQQFLRENPDFCTVAVECPLPGAQPSPWGTVLLPHHTGTDGFFVSVLQRK